jgi:FMN phosphatase YigB (HAD superfamily)
MAIPGIEPPAVFILDCDNTLLDNDALKADLDTKLGALLGQQLTEQFWRVYEEVRGQTGTVDFPFTFEHFRPYLHDDDATLARVRSIIMDYPFRDRLYPATLATLRYLRAVGLTTIVSDGDSIYQPRKIELSGLAAAVEGRVLIYIHKEDHLAEIFARWPSRLYVMVDDKARILAATKALHPDRFVTVHVRQGHYGVDPERFTPPPDITIEHIGDLRNYGVADFARHLAR